MRIIRVDEAVYAKIMVEKHRLERERKRRVSMNTALRSLMGKLRFGSLGSED